MIEFTGGALDHEADVFGVFFRKHRQRVAAADCLEAVITGPKRDARLPNIDFDEPKPHGPRNSCQDYLPRQFRFVHESADRLGLAGHRPEQQLLDYAPSTPFGDPDAASNSVDRYRDQDTHCRNCSAAGRMIMASKTVIDQDFSQAICAEGRELVVVPDEQSATRQHEWADKFGTRGLGRFFDDRPVDCSWVSTKSSTSGEFAVVIRILALSTTRFDTARRPARMSRVPASLAFLRVLGGRFEVGESVLKAFRGGSKAGCSKGCQDSQGR